MTGRAVRRPKRWARTTPSSTSAPPARWYGCRLSPSTATAIAAVITGDRLMNRLVRLGPSRRIACIHRYGARIEVGIPA